MQSSLLPHPTPYNCRPTVLLLFPDGIVPLQAQCWLCPLLTHPSPGSVSLAHHSPISVPTPVLARSVLSLFPCPAFICLHRARHGTFVFHHLSFLQGHNFMRAESGSACDPLKQYNLLVEVGRGTLALCPMMMAPWNLHLSHEMKPLLREVLQGI